MKKITLGILREGKTPPERRVPFTPQQAAEIMRRFPHVSVLCERSDTRCYTDAEYAEAGIPIVSDAGSCDILTGIKEVPPSNLKAGKTYLFFSHTLKKQPHNRNLLQTVLEKKIRLIDYEVLRDRSGKRLVAFGRYAGIIGAYNCFWVYGLRSKRYTLQRAFNCHDYDALKQGLKKVDLPPVKVVLTGSGRVGKGAVEILDLLRIRQVTVDEFLNASANEPVYVHLGSKDYHIHLQNKPFNREEFHAHPERYRSDFLKFAHTADMLIAGAYWNPAAPRLFSAEAMTDPSFSTRIIADITCDIDGSIPATIKATDVYDPVYDYNPATRQADPPFSGEGNITVMAVDNLPCELPRSASTDFGRDLIDKILPSLLGEDTEGIVERATVAVNGALTPGFRYLEDWVGEGV